MVRCKEIGTVVGYFEKHTVSLNRCFSSLLVFYAVCVLLLQVPGTKQDALYVTGRVFHSAQVLLELRLVRGMPGVDASFKSEKQDLASAVFGAVRSSLA